MEIETTAINGVLVIKPDIYRDNRGFFMETYNEQRYRSAGIHARFVQDNVSRSARGILRGLHFQKSRPQAKLVQVLLGDIFDVAVDVRPGSATFGKWVGKSLSGENGIQMFIPEGFAHGFCVLSQTAYFSYKCSDFYAPEDEGGVLWSDPDIGIDWPIGDPILSNRDRLFSPLRDLDKNGLPVGAIASCDS
jgi:dTDP-4-dehydrorhamnose 3,5-epimerase